MASPARAAARACHDLSIVATRLDSSRRPAGLGARALAAGLGLQLAFGLVFAFGAVVPYLRGQEHWPAALTGAVFSATPMGYGTGTLLSGRLADRWPPRRLCWAGFVLLAAGLAVAFLFPSGFTFVVFYGFLALGLGGGVALTGSIAALSQLFPTRTGTVGGAATAAYAGSAVIQAPALSALASHLGWLGALRAVGLGSALVAGALLLLMPSLPPPPSPAELGESHRPGRLELLRRRLIWTGCLLILCGAVFGPYGAINLPADAAEHGLSMATGTGAIVLFSIGNAGGRLAGGLGSDRIGIDRVILALLLLNLVAAVVLWLTALPVLLLLAALAAGVALGAGAGVLPRMGRSAAPDAPNTAFGMVFAGYAFGALTGATLGSVVGGSVAWLVVGAPSLVGLGILRFRHRPERDAA